MSQRLKLLGARIEKSNLLPQQKKPKNTNNTNKSDIFILSLHKQPFNIMFVQPVVIMTKVMIAGTGKWTRCVCVCVCLETGKEKHVPFQSVCCPETNITMIYMIYI